MKEKPFSMSQSKSHQQIEIENKIDNYIRNIQVLITLSSIFQRYGGENGIGSKMTYTTFKGENAEVTPDLVTEMPAKNLGIISESKVSLANNTDYWKEHYDQIKKYDSDLFGWTGSINEYDLLFVTDTILTLKIWEYLNDSAAKEAYRFKHKLGVLQSHREDKVRSFIDIKLEYGSVSDEVLLKELKYGTRTPLQNLFREVDDIKFYDDRPHFIYTMEILWTFVFPSKITIEKYVQTRTLSKLELKVNVDELLSEMRSKFAPQSNPNVIQRSWIKEALDNFVKFGLGLHDETDENKYTIFFKILSRKDMRIRDYFLGLMFKNKKKGVKSSKKAEVHSLDRWFNTSFSPTFSQITDSSLPALDDKTKRLPR